MSSDAENNFEKYARECTRLAGHADTWKLRKDMMDMAREWMRARMDEEDVHKPAGAIRRNTMTKQTSRGRKQDRARVAGGQNYEVRYEAKKTGKSKGRVKQATKRAGPSRRTVERELRR